MVDFLEEDLLFLECRLDLLGGAFALADLQLERFVGLGELASSFGHEPLHLGGVAGDDE